ncbi:MAG: hypothetical protein DLM52_11070 [Chthoniobacterales bacterium]|nr:MAG: hypothetical protein DLM52_11070 [Chthoniobacterales bacterium]
MKGFSQTKFKWCALGLCLVLGIGPVRAISPDDDDDESNVVHPTGVHKHRSARAKTARNKKSTPAPEEEIAPALPAVPAQPSDPTRVPNTRATCVLVVDARTGEVLT